MGDLVQGIEVLRSESRLHRGDFIDAVSQELWYEWRKRRIDRDALFVRRYDIEIWLCVFYGNGYFAVIAICGSRPFQRGIPIIRLVPSLF